MGYILADLKERYIVWLLGNQFYMFYVSKYICQSRYPSRLHKKQIIQHNLHAPIHRQVNVDGGSAFKILTHPVAAMLLISCIFSTDATLLRSLF
jgi:hypothetical protein